MRLERSYEPVDGYEPHSEYCQRFWLPILGPTSFTLSVVAQRWLPCQLETEDLAVRLGVKGHVAVSACKRLARYRIWMRDPGESDTYYVPERTRLISDREAWTDLPMVLAADHEAWVEGLA